MTTILPTLPARRVAVPLAMAVLGSGVLVTEVGNAIVDPDALPKHVLVFFERYNSSEPVAIVLAVLVAPLVEEGLFRGLLLRSLLPFGERVALAGSAVVFAVCHVNPVQGLAALWIGLLFGWVYLRTGSLTLCVAGHALWNAQWWLADIVGAPIPGYTLSNLGGPFHRQPLLWLAVGALALLAGLAILRGRVREATHVP